MKSQKARKQRKYLYNAPLHKKRKWIASHLEENLLLKYDRRSVPVIKGDTVKVMRGSFKGHEDKISHVNVKDLVVEIEGVTMVKADGKKIAKSIHPSNLLITKLNLTDSWRRNTLEKGLTEDAKKEIEKEAQEQLNEREEQQKKVEEEAKREEQRTKEQEELEKEEEKLTEEEPEVPASKEEEKLTEDESEALAPKEEEKEQKPAETKPEEPEEKTEKTPVKKTPAKKSVPKKKKEAEP